MHPNVAVGSNWTVYGADRAARLTCYLGNWVLLPLFILLLRAQAFERREGHAGLVLHPTDSKKHVKVAPTTPPSPPPSPPPADPAAAAVDASFDLSAVEVQPVLVVQRRVRAWLARRAYRRQLAHRRQQLRYFSWPIAVLTLLELIGTLIFRHFKDNGRSNESHPRR